MGRTRLLWLLLMVTLSVEERWGCSHSSSPSPVASGKVLPCWAEPYFCGEEHQGEPVGRQTWSLPKDAFNSLVFKGI